MALTTWDVDDAVVRVIEAGAVGYLLKYSASEELDAGLRRVMMGESVLSPGALAELLRYVRSQPAAAAPVVAAYDARAEERQCAVAQARQAAAGLSRRELDVIAAAAEGLTTEEIATRLYISISTVKTHLHSAQDRVGARNRVHLAVLAERAGLLGGQGRDRPLRPWCLRGQSSERGDQLESGDVASRVISCCRQRCSRHRRDWGWLVAVGCCCPHRPYRWRP